MLLFFLVAACSKGAPHEGPRVLRDGLGREVRTAASVKRVVSLAPSTTEILYALSAEDLIVGVDRYSDYPKAAKEKEQVGSDTSPSLERIVALKPDLVFTATSANGQSTVESLARAGVPVFVSKTSVLDEVYRDIQGIADAVDRGARGRALVADMQRALAAVSASNIGAPTIKTLVVVWTEPLTVVTPKSYVGSLLEIAGGKNVVGDSPIPFPTYSVERVLAEKPEVIIVGTHADNAPPLDPLYKLTTVPAVKNKRIHEIDGDLLFRPGPRLVDGVRAIARLLHPTSDGGAP